MTEEDFIDAHDQLSITQEESTIAVLKQIISDMDIIKDTLHPKNGKILTKPNREKIILLANTTKTNISSLLSMPTLQPCSVNTNTPQNITYIIKATVDETLTQLKHQNNLPIHPTKPSYSQVTKSPTSHTNITPTTKPALIVSTKKATTSSAETLKAWKSNITFRDTNFTPSKIKYISNNKLRIEFDSSEHRDITMKKTLKPECEINAEIPHTLKPSIIIKGIPLDIDHKELTSIIINQNDKIKQIINSPEDLQYKFKKNNKNPKLYNAIFTTTPTIFHNIISYGKINIDHYRIHVSEHIPLLQCYNCLKFGHTKTRCTQNKTICSYCANSGHDYSKCPHKNDTAKLKCFNCSEHSKKSQISTINTIDFTHSATSNFCPQYTFMFNNIRNKINYG